MISWLQTLLQKHYKWLFSGLLAIIIVAFVFTIGNTGGVGSGNPQDIRREFFGVNLNSPRQMQAIQQDTIISAELNGQRLNQASLEGAMFQRITTLYLANQIGVPSPSEAQLADYIRDLPGLQDYQTGTFSPDRYTELLDRFQNSPQSGGEQALLAVINDDFRIEKVLNALGGPGYVLPYMAKRQAEAVDTVWSVDVATLEKSTFKPELDTSDEALTKFYTENELRFATGPRIVVGYIAYPFGDYLAEVEDPKTAVLHDYYRTHRSEYPAGEDGKPQPLDAVKDDVIKNWKLTQAKELAIADANALTVAAYESAYGEKLAPNAASVSAFAKEHGKTLVTLAPFPRDNPSSSVPGVPASALAQAASLETQRFYTDGVFLEDSAAVFFLEEELPSATPPLAEIREQVLEAYTTAETRRQFNLRAIEIKKELQSAVVQGKSFVETATALGLKTESYKDFKLNDTPEGLDPFLRQTIQGMKQGEVSDLLSYGDLGTFIYAASKEVPDVSIDAPEIQENIQQMSSFASRVTTQSILNDLIVAEEARIRPEEF